MSENTGSNGDTASGASTMSDDAIAAMIFDLLSRRAEGATICPTDVARALYSPDDTATASTASGGKDDGWRDLMEPVRVVAGGWPRRSASRSRRRVRSSTPRRLAERFAYASRECAAEARTSRLLSSSFRRPRQ